MPKDVMGHIELATPVSHIWYFKGIPSRMGLILDITPRNLEKVLYFASYIVTDPGDTPLAYKEILSEQQYQDAREAYGKDFKAGMPVLEVKARRIGGANYQVPIEVRPERRQTLGLRWLTKYTKLRGEKTMSERLAKELMVFQNPDNQLVSSIVEDDIAFGPENLGIEPTEIRARVDKALESVRMGEYRKKAAHLLSGGQKQRIAIAGVVAMLLRRGKAFEEEAARVGLPILPFDSGFFVSIPWLHQKCRRNKKQQEFAAA